MTCVIVGSGLVGSYLGIAAGATVVRRGPSGRLAATVAILPDGSRRTWAPADDGGAGLPHLVCTRVHRTPWAELPPGSLLAQNGLGQPLPGLAPFLAVDRDVDGALRACTPPRLVLPRLPSEWDAVIAAWRSVGIAVEVVDDVRPARFEKAVLNATVGPLCRATCWTMAAVWASPGLRQLVLDATAEGEALAGRLGLALPPGLTARAEAFFDRCGAHRPSVLRDDGELPWILGHLLDRARAVDLAVPALTRIADLVAEARR